MAPGPLSVVKEEPSAGLTRKVYVVWKRLVELAFPGQEELTLVAQAGLLQKEPLPAL